MKRFLPVWCLVAVVLPLAGCLHVKTDPIEVKPIHITMDVNVKVDHALDNFFGDLDQKSTTIQDTGSGVSPRRDDQPSASTQP